MKLDISKLDFDHCEDEPIHIPESIQGYGYFFALDQNDETIQIHSENVHTLFKEKDFIGKNFFSLTDDNGEDYEFLKETYLRAKDKNTRLPVRIKFKEDLITAENSADFLAVVYNSNEYIIIELEPADKFRKLYSAEHYIKLYASSIAPKFKSFKGLDEMAQEIVETIKYISSMERVVLYKFNDDQSGKVIAEAKDDDIDSYLGLYYPASDIPPQARELYKKNWVRLTPNVDLEPSRLVPDVNESGRKPVDMTQSLLRTLSPIHNQYIRNQGLKSSFSLSLVTHDQLWGLISCHNREPHYIPQDIRLQCENLSQLFSWHLYAKEEELHLNKKERTESAIDTMLDKISPNFPIVDVFKENEEEVLNIMDADGFVFVSEQEQITIGTVPEGNIVQDTYDRINSDSKKQFHVYNLADKNYDKANLNGIVEMLMVPLIEKRNYYTAWFRKEKVKIQKWAGNPDEKTVNASKVERLTPRSSFKIHIKEIKGHSKPFEKIDLDTAARFNRMFLAYSLEAQDRMQTHMNNMEKNDRQKNEFLATLAHELRNPLAPIGAALSFLEKQDYGAMHTRIVDTMKRQVSHMTRIINDLMEVSRITQGKIKINEDILTIQEVIYSSIEVSKGAIDDRGHTLSTDIPEKDIIIKGDLTRLVQIFSNILNNAAKYTPENGHINMTAKEQGNEIEVSIQDNGLGIPKDKLDTIFSMFSQVEAHSLHTKGGLGIGLTLVERLVKLHDGTITVDSEGVNKGCIFIVRLPIYNKTEMNN